MERRTLVIIAVMGLAAVLVFGAGAAYMLRPSEAPSGELTALPVLPLPQVVQSTPQEGGEATTEVQAAAAGQAVVFEIVRAESEARFYINEILYGNDKTVLGVTNAVAGQLLVDAANTANVQVGPVQVNARTFMTDNGNRNRAIQNFVLQTNAYEYVTFTPTQVSSLPASAAVGDTFSFQLTGDLTIRNITHPVTFDVTVTAESATRISGLATASIARADFNLQIPSVSQVAWVDEVLTLELEFVAEAKD